MPKINVYLPDELAEAVKAAGVPVSAVCQRALERAVGRMTAIREAATQDFEGGEPVGALNRFTARSLAVLKVAAEQSRAAGKVAIGTDDVLGGLLAEQGNLALSVLAALDIEQEQVARDLATRRAAAEANPADNPDTRAAGEAGPRQLSESMAAVMELSMGEALAFGHNYVGTEHLLLGLINEPDGMAGQVLRGLGAETRLTRQAVKAAIVGYSHLKAQTQQAGAGAESAPAGGNTGSGSTGGAAGTAGPAATASAAAAFARMVKEQLDGFAERLGRIERQLNLPAPGTDGPSGGAAEAEG